MECLYTVTVLGGEFLPNLQWRRNALGIWYGYLIETIVFIVFEIVYDLF